MPRPSSRVLATACISLLVILLASSLKPHPPQSKPDNVNMVTALKNVIVIGGSYVGCAAAKELASVLPATHRVLLVEPHSHFHHLFAFPRFAIVPSHEHKAFIPYTSLFSSSPNPSLHSVVRASVLEVHPSRVVLDRPFSGSTSLEYDYLAIATGTRLPSPGSMQDEDKPLSVSYFQEYQKKVKTAQRIVILGGGAVGCQMACDILEVYPDKEVTMVQSREKVMSRFHEGLHEIVKKRFDELGVKLVTGSRAVIPPNGFPLEPTTVTLASGQTIPADLVITATGQTPNTAFLSTLSPTSPSGLLTPSGFVRVLPTLQLADGAYPHIFALGDVADSGAHKAARPGGAQAVVMAKNVVALLDGKQPEEKIVVSPPAIHMSLGLTKNTVFRNPDSAQGETEPWFKLKDDGTENMNIEGVWERRGVKVNGPQEYHL
ncbi:hypothetical protein JCM24511_03073 [Saitozyma sp. JCM 24511]|nr:hypothetical protein JCM24511_03073 [Saitozyma sp. JCM 24511]